MSIEQLLSNKQPLLGNRRQKQTSQFKWNVRPDIDVETYLYVHQNVGQNRNTNVANKLFKYSKVKTRANDSNEQRKD